MRDPFGRVPGVGLLQHPVDLLQRKPLCFGNQEIGVNKAADAKGAPDEEYSCAKVAFVNADHIGGNDGNDLKHQLARRQGKPVVGFTYAVPKPVGSGRKSDTAGTDGKREDLSDDDPGTWTPGGSEEEDVDTDESNHGADCMRVPTIADANNGDDELTDQHAQGAPDEKRATTEPLNGPERDWGGADVDEGGDEPD